MSRPVIEVDNLSKAYVIGLAERANESFKEKVMGVLRSPAARLRQLRQSFDDSPSTFWALKDINFKIEQGETVGIIGRNGAGKSTLLKVLSRITEPTHGHAVMRGRVSSLLEVGTGFHPDLTGRENVYLNGAILGMSRAEIRRKFDAIVEFSEIGKFLDTQVKRYSSGMYVRLAFSVAAHLDPQIMIVDEVLAVGDAAFQKKCLGKMNDVVKQEGRTILFVSHSMDAIAGLCKSALVFNKGKVSEKLTVDEGIRLYLEQNSDNSDVPLAQKPRTQNRERPPIFTGLTISHSGRTTNVIPAGGAVDFEVEVENFEDDAGSLTCGIALLNTRGQRVTLFHSLYQSDMTFRAAKRRVLRCHVPHLPITAGEYFVELVFADGFRELERVERAGSVRIVFGDVLGTGKIPNSGQSMMVLPAAWSEAS
jgi:lipopolysaccharide transport system ATP-binding protein